MVLPSPGIGRWGNIQLSNTPVGRPQRWSFGSLQDEQATNQRLAPAAGRYVTPRGSTQLQDKGRSGQGERSRPARSKQETTAFTALLPSNLLQPRQRVARTPA